MPQAKPWYGSAMKRLPLHRSAHAIHQLYLHLVFVTYRRDATLDLTREKEYRDLFADICCRIGQKAQPNAKRPENLCGLIEFGMEQDHVHLLVRYPTTITIAQLVQYLKGISSHEWPDKKRYGEQNAVNRLWSASYFAKTVGHMSIQQTKEYQRNQGKSSDKKDLAKASATEAA
jgi:putative transposase